MPKDNMMFGNSPYMGSVRLQASGHHHADTHFLTVEEARSPTGPVPMGEFDRGQREDTVECDYVVTRAKDCESE